jgi:hypothetical protein
MPLFSVTVAAWATSWEGTGKPANGTGATVTVAWAVWPAVTDTPFVLPSSTTLLPPNASTLTLYMPGCKPSNLTTSPGRCAVFVWVVLDPITVTWPESTVTGGALAARTV